MKMVMREDFWLQGQNQKKKRGIWSIAHFLLEILVPNLNIQWKIIKLQKDCKFFIWKCNCWYIVYPLISAGPQINTAL